MPLTVARPAEKKLRAGRPCTVCSHPKRESIDRDLIEGGSAVRVAAKFRAITEDAVTRHARKHLPQRLAKAAAAKETVTADRALAQLEKCLNRVNLLMDACDEWLRDPENPERYYIGPRAEDVMVT